MADSVVGPAIFAGAVAIFATSAVERWGGRLGGLLGSLPTTVVPAAWGMAAASPERLERALAGVPPGMLINAVFLLMWRELPRRLPPGPLAARLRGMVVGSLAVWAVLAGVSTWGLGAAEGAGLPPIRVAAACAAATAVLGLMATARGGAAPRGHRAVAPRVLLLRGVLAAAAIAGALYLQRHGGGVIVGIAAVFPSIFLTAMVGLWTAQGEAVPAGAAGPMMLGSTGVAAFALLASQLVPEWGRAPGLAMAWILAVLLVDVPAWFWLRSRPAGADVPPTPKSIPGPTQTPAPPP